MLQTRTDIYKGSSCETIEEIGLSRWSKFSGVKECLDQDAEKGRDTERRVEKTIKTMKRVVGREWRK